MPHKGQCEQNFCQLRRAAILEHEPIDLELMGDSPCYRFQPIEHLQALLKSKTDESPRVEGKLAQRAHGGDAHADPQHALCGPHTTAICPATRICTASSASLTRRSVQSSPSH